MIQYPSLSGAEAQAYHAGDGPAHHGEYPECHDCGTDLADIIRVIGEDELERCASCDHLKFHATELEIQMDRFAKACRKTCAALDRATVTMESINADLREIKEIAADLAKRRHAETFEAAAERRNDQ